LWDAHLRRHGCGRIEYHDGDLRDSIEAQAADGYHQAGTTRMSHDPGDGVVDEHLRVHRIDNLHVASSSAFVTSGQANTTFMIVVFALRLVDRLHDTLRA
jgi:choline dehydrogenase-like flavoprotein